MIRQLLTSLGETRWSVALHESLYMWPLLESTHVLSLTLFVGTAAMLDLRLLGVAFRRVPATEFTLRLLPWTRTGFAVMVLTGVLLFSATPITYYESLFFRIKVILLLAAGANVWWFHTHTERGMGNWEMSQRPPRAARIAAIVSLTAWTGVVVAGRLVAYNWFACDLQPQPAIVNTLAGCVVPPPPAP